MTAKDETNRENPGHTVLQNYDTRKVKPSLMTKRQLMSFNPINHLFFSHTNNLECSNSSSQGYITIEFRSEERAHILCLSVGHAVLCPETNQKAGAQIVDGNMCSRMINASCENVTVDRKDVTLSSMWFLGSAEQIHKRLLCLEINAPTQSNKHMEG